MKKLFGIIGKPVSHSASAEWYSQHFVQHKIDADFDMSELAEEDINRFRTWVLEKRYNGLLVTAPYKKAVIPFLDSIDRVGAAVGAVNIIQVSEGKLFGYNSDCRAFESAIYALRPEGFSKALLLGNGGAAAAVEFVLKKNNIAYVKCSRRPGPDCVLYGELNQQQIAECNLIVNATTLGMNPNENKCPGIPYPSLNRNALAYDLIYNPPETLFLKKCAEAGCQTSNGRGMVENVYKQSLETWGLV